MLKFCPEVEIELLIGFVLEKLHFTIAFEILLFDFSIVKIEIQCDSEAAFLYAGILVC